MSLARIRERQHCANACPELSGVDEAGDLCQMPGCDVDEEEGAVDAMRLRKILIGTRYCRDQLAASTQNLK